MGKMNCSLRILLVEDVQLDRMQLSIRLKQLGHVVEAVSSGSAALNLFSSFEPDLVLLDIIMPGMSGFDVASAIRLEHDDWVPIIFLSSHHEPEMIAKAIEAGGDDYLVKPVDNLVLTSKLLAMSRIADMRRELKRTSSRLTELNHILQLQVNEDSLTQIFNRRYMDEKVAEMISWHGRHKLPLSLILFDVDQFKIFNDFYGHTEGDKCLYTLSQTFNQLFTRSGEYVGRYGGEEFIVLLSHSDLQMAQLAAKRIMSAIKLLNYPHEKSSVEKYVTVSLGLVSMVPNGDESTSYLYNLADKAMYQAKQEGRNCSIVCSDQHFLDAM
ncbi:diguanylate cyclase domain-containing protein [Vibrio sp. RC27]